MRIDAGIREIINTLSENRSAPVNTGGVNEAGGSAVSNAIDANRTAGSGSTGAQVNAREPLNRGTDDDYALLEKLPPEIRDAARAVLAYQTPLTADIIEKLLSYTRMPGGMNIQNAALLVTGGVDAALSDIGLLSDIINGRYSITNEFIKLIDLYEQAAGGDGVDIMREAVTVRAVIDSLTALLPADYAAAFYEANVNNTGQTAGIFESLAEAMLTAARGAPPAAEGQSGPEPGMAHTGGPPIQAQTGVHPPSEPTGGPPIQAQTDGTPYQAQTGVPSIQAQTGGSPPSEPTGGTPYQAQTGVHPLSNPMGGPPIQAQTGGSFDANIDALSPFITKIFDDLLVRSPGVLEYFNAPDGPPIQAQTGGSTVQPQTYAPSLEHILETAYMTARSLYAQYGSVDGNVPPGAGNISGDAMDYNPAMIFRSMFYENIYKTPDGIFANPASAALNIKTQYELILLQLNIIRTSIKQRLKQTPEKTEALRQTDRLENGLRLINNLNNRHQYAQIPLLSAGWESDLELFVMKRGGSKKKIDPEDATLFISLATANIGKVESLIHIGKNKNVSIDLRAESEGILSLLRDGRLDLHGALAAKGYKLARATYRLIIENTTASNAAERANALFPRDKRLIDYRI